MLSISSTMVFLKCKSNNGTFIVKIHPVNKIQTLFGVHTDSLAWHTRSFMPMFPASSHTTLSGASWAPVTQNPCCFQHTRLWKLSAFEKVFPMLMKNEECSSLLYSLSVLPCLSWVRSTITPSRKTAIKEKMVLTLIKTVKTIFFKTTAIRVLQQGERSGSTLNTIRTTGYL